MNTQLRVNLPTNQIDKVFPEAASICKDTLSNYKLELEEKKEWIKKQEKRLSNLFYGKKHTGYLLAHVIINYKLYVRVDFLEDRVDELTRINKRYNYKPTKKKGIDKEDVKDIPISDFIEFNRSGFACCVFHNEKTPSMKYYRNTNTVHCFGCSKTADVIDVISEMEKLSFKESLAFLNQHRT